MAFKIPEMGAIKRRKSENVKEEFIGDEYDKIKRTLCPERFEGQKVLLMYSSLISFGVMI